MTQEEKQLLLIDLSARLPYDVMIYLHTSSDRGSTIVLNSSIYGFIEDVLNNSPYEIKEIKPFLRPMSSMSDEEFQELHNICPHVVFNKTNVPGWIVGIYGSDYGRTARIDEISKLIDWLNAHHFDYRGLIEKGLALEAPEGMYNKN